MPGALVAAAGVATQTSATAPRQTRKARIAGDSTIRRAAKPPVDRVSHFSDERVSHLLHLRGYGRCMAKTATPFGAATLVERVALPQRVGDRRFSSLVELLETERGERLVRIAYSTDGVVRRGPVTLRVRDLDRLRAALEKTPELTALLAGAA
jgi:hypothetical protein